MPRELSPEKELFVTFDDACARLGGISRMTLYRIIRRGKLKTTKLGARRMVTVRALQQFVARTEQAGGVVLPNDKKKQRA